MPASSRAPQSIRASSRFQPDKTGADRIPQLRGTDGETVKVSAGKPDPGFRLNGKFALDHQNSLRRIPLRDRPARHPYTADGKAVDLGVSPRFSIEANGAQVQFDEAVGCRGRRRVTLRSASRRLAAALDMPKPTIPGTIEVNLPAVVAGDTTVRDVHFPRTYRMAAGR
jgi:hypothetical protein